MAGLSSYSQRSLRCRPANSLPNPQTRRPAMNRCPKIGYVLKRFPRLSETFILNELLELERIGTPLEIYSLIDVAKEESNRPRHKLVEELKSEVTYLPPRQPLKKWHVRQGRLSDGDFTKR